MNSSNHHGMTRKISYKKQLISNFLQKYQKDLKDKGETPPELIDIGLTYIQMRISVEKITPHFEEFLKEKISHSILNAKIREAVVEDLEKIVRIHNRAWMTGDTPYTPISLEGIRKVFEIPSIKIFIAKVYGEDGGFIITDLIGESKDIGEIVGLGILPRFQRKYLGTILGIHSWEYFKKNNVKELRCEVYENNAASYKLIKGLGFEEFGRTTYGIQDFDPIDDS